ncbi:MAG TPA: sulfatase [Actinophytocola sp.]|uniref:sulfatase family protein n=1 Tax=Actinophytocola sp. TaxID=1872138 RepID=UPI002F954385
MRSRVSRLVLTVAAAGVLTSGVAVAVGAPEPAAPAADERPNFVLILADDLDSATTPLWEVMPATAALIRDRGVDFTNGFAPMPICCASRSSLLTGKYGHNTGVLTNSGEVGGFETFVANGNEDHTVARYLHDAGYRTGLAGKYLNGLEKDPAHIPPGWSEWYAGVDNNMYSGYDYTLNENGTFVHHGHRPADYLTDVVRDKSVGFIENAAKSGAPFFFYAASTAPHFPIPPAPRHRDNPYTHATVPRSPNLQERDVSDKPTWLRDSAMIRSAIVAGVNDPDYRNRLGSLLALDEMVGAIVDTLARTGELDDTYLVFTSDNGYSLGAHRLVQKMAPYEESMRVPLAIAGPGIKAGERRQQALSIDFAPTLLDLAGVRVPGDVDGRSLVPLLGGGNPKWRTDFAGEYGGGGRRGTDGVVTEAVPGHEDDEMYVVDMPSWSGVRTDRYLYVRWYERERALPDREYELYDLRKDPYQLTNLIATPEGEAEYAGVVAALDHRLGELIECSGASCRNGP